MNQNQLRDDTAPRSVDQQQACYAFRVGETYETQAGNLITVIGREGSRGYECLQCSDGIYRYDRSIGGTDAGRVTGTAHDYSCADNFKRHNNRISEPHEK
ncbi:MAG: hypothetical protein IPO08_21055 [Xanthomonadales bacterium]|nr:hypothetical protein [Xanthomonadales bacterium]